MEGKIKKILELKKEKGAVILAHYYTNEEVQEIADYVGDSYFLSEIAQKLKEKVIVMCGVFFMGESAKILNPEKTILIPDEKADCPMAHMADIEKIKEVRKKYEDVAVVCYVNSTAELKAASDVCVTSANALKIVKKLSNKNIYFIPDEHLGRYVASKVPEKNFIFNNGCCYVHAEVTKKDVEEMKEKYPNAEILVHPECRKEISDMGDYVGSTSGILKYAAESKKEEFIICTEIGIMYELKKNNPDKKFYSPAKEMVCSNMKKISLEKIIRVLEANEPQVHLDLEFIENANKTLKNMLELGK
ncbi:MAG: quinolinate synthase NadA [Fusobacterium varium]|uniref:quinolinate synthase NadA n=1 Tax=Fusobacterium varium TaxID=856 RepID=UPI0039910748